MKTPVLVALSVMLALGGCGSVRESRMNPFNWFGPSTAAPVDPVADGTANPLIPQREGLLARRAQDDPAPAPPVASVTAIEVLERPGGAILKARGVTAGAAPHAVALIPDPGASDAATLAFVLTARTVQGDPGPVSARRVVAALSLSDQQLAGIRTIRVAGADDAQVTRR